MKKKDIKKKNEDWVKKLKYRIVNKKWLDYSAQIAMRIDAVIEGKIDFTQNSLAKTLKVSPQQVSKILKGEQNLTLKTIANLGDALGIELISFPAYKDSFINLLNCEVGSYTINDTVTQTVQLNKGFDGPPDNRTKEVMQIGGAIVINMNGKSLTA